MPLPDEIPERLKSAALRAPESNAYTWSKDGALDVLNCLSGSKVVVESITVHELQSWGLVAVGEDWTSSQMLPGELGTDYAQRTQQSAGAFVQKHDERTGGFYAIEFSLMDDAA